MMTPPLCLRIVRIADLLVVTLSEPLCFEITSASMLSICQFLH